MIVWSRRSTLASLVALVFAAPAFAADAPAPVTLHFGDAVRLAAREAAPVLVAGLKVEEASARIGQARSVLLPSLGGGVLMGDHTVDLASEGFTLPSLPDRIGPFQSFDARARVSQTLLDPSGWRRIGAARESERQSVSERDGSAEGAAQGGAIAWLRAARAEALTSARAADLAIAEELAQMAEAQLKAGTSPQIDFTRARTQVAVSRGALLLARHEAERSRIELARALALDPLTPITLADTLGPALGAAVVRDTSVETALGRRPELLGEGAKLARAQADRGVISSERYGRIDASADWGWSGAHASDALWTRDYMLGYTIPIFDGLRRESRLQEQAQVVRESEVRIHDLRDQVSAEVAQARIVLAAADEQYDVAIERLTLSLEELAEARDRFTNGVAGNLDVIQAQSNLVRARDAEVETRYAIAAARVALARALGIARELE
jgi:outer membrane protein